MLKEQVAEIICNAWDISWNDIGKHTKSEYLEEAGKIINLFKAEVDKLTVIGNEMIASIASGVRMSRFLEVRDVAGHQLQADKKRLYDLIRE